MPLYTVAFHVPHAIEKYVLADSPEQVEEHYNSDPEHNWKGVYVAEIDVIDLSPPATVNKGGRPRKEA